MILEEEGLKVLGSQVELLTPVYTSAAIALEGAGIDAHTADELATRIVARVHERWQSLGMIVREVKGVDL
jgi:hypothetical protein